MKKGAQRRIEVWADWHFLSKPEIIGVLYTSPARGKEIFSFEYTNEWLSSKDAQLFDPSLRHFRGQQYPSASQNNFGSFLDSAPDRWGRVLMDRREAFLARSEGRPERRLLESDYLLGVYDGHRLGGLRFKVSADGSFLSDDKLQASPPWTSLSELEHASLELERPDAETKAQYGKWLRLLMAPGSSLGGARPKCSVVDKKGDLWIAKFPSRQDRVDVGAWEAVAFELARQAGINVASFELKKFSSSYRTVLSKRFDRTKEGKRVHFASAMTLLQRAEGDDSSKGVSYMDFVPVIQQAGANPKRDLEELWRRIVFFVSISNTDDHLRNHGFLLSSSGWSLAPAYDLNPNPLGEGLTLNVSETDNSLDIELARSVASYFRLSAKRSKEIIEEVCAAVRNWKGVAKAVRIPRSEQERMASAFRW